MTSEDREQRCKVDAVLKAVERTLAFQHEVREGVLSGRLRVDELVKAAIERPREG